MSDANQFEHGQHGLTLTTNTFNIQVTFVTLLRRYHTELSERFSVMKQITLTTLFWPLIEFIAPLQFNQHKLMNTEKRGKLN
jgi:hypothetical protein